MIFSPVIKSGFNGKWFGVETVGCVVCSDSIKHKLASTVSEQRFSALEIRPKHLHSIGFCIPTWILSPLASLLYVRQLSLE